MTTLQLTWVKGARRSLRGTRKTLGTFGLVGLSLLLLAGGLYFYAPTLDQQARRMRADVDRARGQLDDVRKQLASRPNTAHQAAQMREWFPTSDHVTADLRVLFDTARKNHVELLKGEYTMTAGADASRLQRFEVVLPVRDRYVTIKSFVGEVLNAVPHASLSELRIERNAATADQLDARVHFTLFYRES